MKNGILAILAAIGSTLAHYLGGWDAALIFLLCMMGIDYITGIAVAMVFHASPKTEGGGLASGECFKGLVRKMLILVFVFIGNGLDTVLNVDYARTAVVIFFIGNEGISIIENAGLMGVPLPSFLKKALEALKDKGDKAE